MQNTSCICMMSEIHTYSNTTPEYFLVITTVPFIDVGLWKIKNKAWLKLQSNALSLGHISIIFIF